MRLFDFLANFVPMKKSLAYLPEEKRRDLRQLAAIIREEIKDVVMVILYGSYARGTYVDYDQRTEFGVRTYYMSDYDMLIVTKRRIGANAQSVYGRIDGRFFHNKAKGFHTRPEFINESIGDFNRMLEKGQYFYTEIKAQGVMLYDSKDYKLARRRKLDFTEIGEIAQRYFIKKFAYANGFLEIAKDNFENKESPIKYQMTAFLLHQAAENFLHAIPLVFELYGYKDHKLSALLSACKRHTLEPYMAFPMDTAEDKRLFDLLQDAYVQARYNDEFVVTKSDIDALIPKIELLRDIVERVCKERIAEYGRQN